ncbi:MAG: hypothetical protein K6C97_03440 [Treponema sp.]|nr:hypothetical protein [Treponema sp.]
MKSTLKNLLKLTSCTALVALLFSCTPATGSNGSTTGSDDTVTGTSGVTFGTTYTDPTLPASVGTDPFTGHTYRYSYVNGSEDYTFGNNNELTVTSTFTSTTTSGTTTSSSGLKYSYSYDATTKELSIKITQVLQKMPGSTESRWYTYAEYINFYLNITRSQLAESGDTTTYTDEQLRELIQIYCNYIKTQFETTTIWKAELNTSNNLVLRRSYYKTAPSSLTNNSTHSVSYSSSQISNGTYTSIGFSLSIYPTTTAMSTGSGAVLYSKGGVSTNKYSSGTSVSKNFYITDITSNTISAAEYTTSSAGYTIVSGGVTLQLGYTYALGNDNTLVITVTGSDDTTKEYLRTLLGDNTLTNPSITASSSTYSQTYTLVQ